MSVRSEWLTGIRIRRIALILLRLPGLIEKGTTDQVTRSLWKICGGSLEEIADLVGYMVQIKLLRVESTVPKRTLVGDKLARQLRATDISGLGRYLVRAGCFHDQARLLLELGKLNADGSLICSIRTARTAAPQLVSLLGEWDDVELYPHFSASPAVVQEINSVWALLPPVADTPTWLAERKQVGERAEMYSLQYEKTRSEASKIIWVSRDSDSLGYDIEDRSTSPRRCIEVKGRRDADVVFFLSENEWKTAQKMGGLYEIHFWGGIDLRTEPAIEYSSLRQAGYPLIFVDPTGAVAPTLIATPVSWKLELIKTE